MIREIHADLSDDVSDEASPDDRTMATCLAKSVGIKGLSPRAVRRRECEIKASSAEGTTEMVALLSRAISAKGI